ncbi:MULTISPECIES: ParA family protein [Enterococcus]|uniref:ParA family protein n=1 Tax=Enterococcus TaxID=1350 RepID=UPI0008B25D43|nr:ParA family protein [Enterococcus malodoratus]SET88331.1 Cellulose biosynthesis protein BcsQ [Enterococcus malodoratus]
MAITLTVGNYKGGVGKTKNNILNAYELAKKGFKTLVVDLDPQANATTVLLRTKKLHSDEVFSFEKTLMSAIKEGDITSIETEIMPNLSLLPSYIDFANYSTFLDLTYGLVEETDPRYSEITSNKINHFKSLLAPLKEQYDYIFIDVPPTKSYITDSAVLASDYVLIVLQTQELSLDGAVEYLSDLQKLANEFNGNFEIVGVLPVLMDGNASLDNFVLENATNIFGSENMFNIKIPNMARLKRFDNTGITEFDRHDKKVIDLYDLVSNELIERINYFEGE